MVSTLDETLLTRETKTSLTELLPFQVYPFLLRQIIYTVQIFPYDRLCEWQISKTSFQILLLQNIMIHTCILIVNNFGRCSLQADLHKLMAAASIKDFHQYQLYCNKSLDFARQVIHNLSKWSKQIFSLLLKKSLGEFTWQLASWMVIPSINVCLHSECS